MKRKESFSKTILERNHCHIKLIYQALLLQKQQKLHCRTMNFRIGQTLMSRIAVAATVVHHSVKTLILRKVYHERSKNISKILFKSF